MNALVPIGQEICTSLPFAGNVVITPTRLVVIEWARSSWIADVAGGDAALKHQETKRYRIQDDDFLRRTYIAYPGAMSSSANDQWWWVPLFSGLPAFVGGLVAVWISSRQERRRRRQEEQKRWHADRIGAYTTFASSARVFGDAVLVDWGSDKGAFHYGDALRDFLNASSMITIIGSNPAKLQAGAVYSLLESAFLRRDRSPSGRQGFHSALGRQINAFVEIARKDLGS